MKWLLIVVGGMFVLTQSYWQPHLDNWRCARIAEKLTEQYGLVIRYSNPSNFFVPPQKPLVDVPEKGFSIEHTNARYAYTALKGVRDSLSQYPSKLIKKHLKAVFIAGVIKTHGVQIGGSYFYSWIYLSALEKYETAGPEIYALNFHHELSSLLLASGSFPRDQWSQINPADFEYLSIQKDVVQSAAQKNRKEAKDASTWCKAGFVHDYGMSSLENDFNMYAELAMTNPDDLIQLAKQYPKIKAKTNILVKYYSSLAPELGAYFESVGLTN